MLPIEQFYKQCTTFDGYQGICKQCSNEAIQCRYNMYKKSAKSKGRSFTITQDEFSKITSQPCHYCGEFEKEDKKGNAYNGLDRVDTTKGYELNNIVACCATCNRMKLDHTEDFFLKHIKKILLHTKQKEII